MNHGKLELITGTFVLLGLAAVTYLALRMGAGQSLGSASYPLEARFSNASGLNSGSRVVIAGVTVGHVDSVEVDASDFSAIAKLHVREGFKLPADTMASIKTSGLLGDKFIQLSPGADEVFLQPRDRITLTESSVDLESLIGKIAFGKVEEEPAPASPTVP